jgi:hypothetical protein
MGSINKILTCDVHDNENINELKAIAKDYYKRIEEFNTNIDLENLDLDYFVEMQQNINKLKTEISGVLHSFKEQIKQKERRNQLWK